MITYRVLTLISLLPVYAFAMEKELSQSSHPYQEIKEEERSRLDQSTLAPTVSADKKDKIDPLQLYQMGYSYYHAATSSPVLKQQNLQKARSYLIQAVEQGEVEAANLLAWMWERGEGGKVDLQKAEKLYLLAKRNNVEGADINLANFYKKTNQSDKALKMHLSLASQGDVNAKIAAGSIYLEGGNGKDNIQPNIDEAIRLYKEAAKKAAKEGNKEENIKAKYALSRAYFKSKLYKDAVKYLKEICQSDEAEKALGKVHLGGVKTALANLYGFEGYGTPEDAILLYQEAIGAGNKSAKRNLKILQQKLSIKKKAPDGGHAYSVLGADAQS